MKLLPIRLVILIFLLVPLEENFSQNVSIPSVEIKDHKENSGVINIDCDYDFLPNNGIQLKAIYPEIRQTNNYEVSSIDYVPIGDFNQGEVVDIRNNNGKLDDTYSGAIDIPFAFCFYGNTYSKIIISDNGVLSFNTALAQQECPYAPPNMLPTGLPKNSIFGVFHDMQNTNQVRYRVEGSSPSRRIIVNYTNIAQYGYAMPGKNSTSQIVLYEGTNIIDVYVKDRFKNESNNPIFEGTGSYRKNAVIGLTNYDSSGGITTPERDTGNWEAHNEAWRFTPNGSTNITINWYDEYNSEISGTRNLQTILVYPTQSTKYNVKVTYNMCTPISVQDIIEVKFSQDFPTTKEVTTAAFCVNNDESYTLDLIPYELEINSDSSLSFSYFEDKNLAIPIVYPKSAYIFSNNKTIYAKVLKSGVCYSVGKLNLRLNKKPVITPNQFFEKCDENNDGKETINLAALGIYGLNNCYYKFFDSPEAAIAGNPEITNYTAYPLDITAEAVNTKTLYLQVWNAYYNDLDCYTVVPFKIKLKKYVEVKKPEKPFLICHVIENQLVVKYDLTQYESQLLEAPSTGVNFEYYTDPSYNAYYKIPNPALASFTMNATIYIKAKVIGYCDAYTQIVLAADNDCDGTPGGGGGGGNSTGPGGSGGGGGSICDTDESSFTVNLDSDYLRFYLQGSLTLSDITLIGFYDSANNSLLTDTAPYSYHFSPPFFKVIQARYTINTTGLESYVNFPVSASKKATIYPDTFDICDTYNDGKESITLKANYNSKPKWQAALEAEYPEATICFFSTSEDLHSYEADPGNPINSNKIITDITLTIPQTTVYVYVKYYGCIYTHEIHFTLVPVIVKSINQPYMVCDFNDDKKELINIIKITTNETDVKDELTPSQLIKLQCPIRYYQIVTQAHTGTSNNIINLTDFEINAQQMAVFARLDIEEECPVIVEVKFQFTTSVALPALRNLIICDINNDNQERVNLNEALISSDSNAEISLYGTPEAVEEGNEASPFFISTGMATNYHVTISPTTIYVRVYDKVTSCWEILNFTVILVKTPVLINTIIENCDFENDGKEVLTTSYMQAQLIANNSDISSTMTYNFYETQAEAIANRTPSLSTFEATEINSIWVNIAQSIGDCPILVALTFNLVKSPILETKPLVYTICNNNTGNENGATKENVILDRYRSDVLGFPTGSNYMFTYYDTNTDDAITGGSFGSVPSAYTVTSFPKTIWIRVVYKPTGCFSIKPIIFQQTSSLESLIKDSEIVACANGEMAMEINLKNYPPQMITGLANLNDFDISYHNSRANAVGNIIISSDITHFNATPASQIWIKFVSKATGCYIVKKLSVTIYSTPKAQDIFPEVCDETDWELDGNYSIPDLDVYKNQIITGESNIDNLYVFTYYKKSDDAIAGNEHTINKQNYTFTEADLKPGAYPNTNFYSIYARIDKQDDTGCFSVVGISFQINKKVPITTIQPEILKCDEANNDGKTRFDLTTVKDKISTAIGVGFKYYSTKENAQNSINEIKNINSWQNLSPYEHIVYIRVSALGYCDNIASIKLKVYPYIKANDYEISDLCEFESDGKTETTVNLVNEVKQMTLQINNLAEYPNLLDDIDISFYVSLINAQNPTVTNSIPTSDLSTYGVPVGITKVWVRLQSRITKCLEIKQLTIIKLKAPKIKVKQTPFRCSANNTLLDAVVALIPSKQDEIYSYSFDNGVTFSDTNEVTVNTEKTIDYVVIDKKGCRITGNVLVPGYIVPTNLDITATPIYCNTIGGVATVTVENVTGGIGPYTYEIIEPLVAAVSNKTGVFPNLLPNTYQIKVIDDATKCYLVKPIEVAKAPEIKVVKQLHSDVNCYGGNTGSITYAVSNYSIATNYTYKLIPNPLAIEPFHEGDVITYTNLPAGKYTFIVTDVISGCTDEVGLMVNQPVSPLKFKETITNITCNGANDGKIVITATGGTGIIKYAISPNLTQFSDTHVFDNLPPGTYQILVQDELGCLGNGQSILEIKEPHILQGSVIGSIMQETCNGAKDGAFAIAIFGGTPPYSASLDNKTQGFRPVEGTELDFTNIVGGIHKVFIKDANCLTDVEVVMDKAVTLAPQAKINYNCVDNTAANLVTITVHESNINSDDIDYALDKSKVYQQSNIFVNVAPGKHTVTARHTNGCEQTTIPFSIYEVQKLTLTEEGLNEIVATASGGAGGYQYTFNGESYGSVNKFIIYKSGTYIVTVTDKNGCTAIVSKHFEYIDVCIPNYFTPNGDGINDTWAPGCTVNYKDLTFDILDRYGRIICKYKLGQKWDGKYNGAELPSGDYWYVIKLNDNKDNRELVGHFTLYR
ncbi:T9SS type B sorting domain-containing protein [Flavobacterium sp. LS1R47]|uniref:T9SS type B sorting domain-containing protein n=1 Tax=Flavobacterium frigoritolerans TaxID=2987686 RepID=A0A9X2Z009_9FLAO|nr:T9SS type B sorting domain-containing protein [Flavobacterium frigoritolerans]MCV9932913.1 T9SS type B sorting domain-containing protein [Flavobacterium frigoritolerans]